MARDRIAELHVQGLRTLADVRLRLGNLTVLTGENGSGKSTLIEACEILRRAAEPNFLEEFFEIHGGLDALLSHGTDHVRLSVKIEGAIDSLEYSVAIEDVVGLAVKEERLTLHPAEGAPVEVLHRKGREGTFLNCQTGSREQIARLPASKLLLTGFGVRVPHPGITRTIRSLQLIDVQLPFPVLPSWVVRTVGNLPSMRVSKVDMPADSLARLGANLANVYQAFGLDRANWETTLDYVRLGLGDDIESVSTRATEGGDGLEIWFKYAGFSEEVPARSLSDGTLDYLAFVALFRLAPKRSIIAFDEPEGQLHPTLVVRVAQFLESMSERQTILITTHSDRLLDALTAPETSVVLCSLDERRQTRLMRPDAAALKAWLADYRGFGDLRAVGHDVSVMTRDGSKT